MFDLHNAASLAFAEDLYEQYQADPSCVPDDWRAYFDALKTNGTDAANGNGAAFRTAPAFRSRSVFNPHPGPASVGNGHAQPAAVDPNAPAATITNESGDLSVLQERVDMLIRNYRVRGHIIAKVDPLDRPRPHVDELDPIHHGINDAVMDRVVSTGTLAGPQQQTVREVIDRLETTYCRSIGVQFMHIHDLTVRNWLQGRMESTENRTELDGDEQRRILRRLTDAVAFEEFLQTKYIGAKTFSLEGAETLIPLMDLAIETAGDLGIREIIIGMAHRGRLNVLANIMGKAPERILREFEDLDPQHYIGGGDVKYHLGYSGDWQTTAGKNVHLSLCFNPSHLEFINPVAEGRLRAKQDRVDDKSRNRGMCMLIHGDSAVIGEGVVQETLNLSQLEGYKTGGTLHVVVNNQLGFTTEPHEYRSTDYSTAIAAMLQIPIFHVNGEDPEAVAHVVRLAMDFRRQFKRDVVIDMYCFRRRGHNEGDEPEFTQPDMYKVIEKRESVRQSYLAHLQKMGDVTRTEADAMMAEINATLEAAQEKGRTMEYRPPASCMAGYWSGYTGGPEDPADEPETGLPRKKIVDLFTGVTSLPDSFTPHRKIKRAIAARRQMADGKKPLDWAAAEALAFASLAVEGHRIRLSGQDCERGTFSQRHSVLHDVKTNERYSIFSNLSPDQAPVEIYNSPLSEAGVLGFDYGYSLDYPEGLILWEAQFGDFVNAAQVIIDQFIASAEDKWRRLSGLTMLLPHGFEGQGPEHSSARLERFLMQAAEDNMQICQPTTPAQYYHLLRRQTIRRWRKPLVIFTPKSLLRHQGAVSPIGDLTAGTYQRVLWDHKVSGHDKVDRVLICTGRVYYDLIQRRADLERDDVAIIRLEQLYPFPMDELHDALAGYADNTQVIWVQDEPRNMGAWPYLWSMFGIDLFERFKLTAVTRPASASPATGSGAAHRIEQEQLMSEAFGDHPGDLLD